MMSDDQAIEPCKTFKNVKEPVSSGTVNETDGIVGTSNSETSSSALSNDSSQSSQRREALYYNVRVGVD